MTRSTARDAIWSHRGNASIHPLGTGPEDGPQMGGIEVGEGGVSDPSGANIEIPDNPTGLWVSDYTMQPENGGLSVFAHEFGHDLGLPDLYDTSGNTGGADNSIGFWSLMSQSRGTAPGDDGIGDRPMPFGAWEKFQLGWLDYKSVHAGRAATIDAASGPGAQRPQAQRRDRRPARTRRSSSTSVTRARAAASASSGATAATTSTTG